MLKLSPHGQLEAMTWLSKAFSPEIDAKERGNHDGNVSLAQSWRLQASFQFQIKKRGEQLSPLEWRSKGGQTFAQQGISPLEPRRGSLQRRGALAATVRIKSCYDGDSCRTITGKKVRLVCIDTPELRVKRADPLPAKTARDHLWLLVAEKLVIIRRVTTDRYERTVDELLADGLDVQ